MILQSSEAIASKLQPITSSKEYDSIVKSGQPVVVDFYVSAALLARLVGCNNLLCASSTINLKPDAACL